MRRFPDTWRVVLPLRKVQQGDEANGKSDRERKRVAFSEFGHSHYSMIRGTPRENFPPPAFVLLSRRAMFAKSDRSLRWISGINLPPLHCHIDSVE